MAMAGDSLKVIFLMADVDYAVESGGLTAPERSTLAKRFGVSEEVLLRYERARRVYNSTIEPKLWDDALTETGLRLKERGEKFYDADGSYDFAMTIRRLRDTLPENEITRELDEALAALRAALDAANPPPAEGQ